MSEEYLMTGSFGLDNDAWQSIFYDDDLPQDWRAAYYSTLLRSVYLSQSEWHKALENDWADEVDEDFRFVLYMHSAGEMQKLSVDSSGFAARVAGVVLEYKHEEGPLLADCVLEIQQQFPVCLDAGAAGSYGNEIRRVCAEMDISCVWYPSIQQAPLPSGSLLVTLINDETLLQRKEIVTTIQRWLTGKRRAGLFNSSKKDAPVKAQETRILAELMGV